MGYELRDAGCGMRVPGYGFRNLNDYINFLTLLIKQAAHLRRVTRNTIRSRCLLDAEFFL